MDQTWKNFFICFSGGLIFYYLFYDKVPGISYPLFTIFVYVLFYIRVPRKEGKSTWFEKLLLAAVLLLSVTFALYNDFVLLFLNFLLVPFLMFVHMTFARRWHGVKWRNHLFALVMFKTFAETVYCFFTTHQFVRQLGKGLIKEEKINTVKKMMIGLIISIPLLWTIISLLMSSDEHFRLLVGRLPGQLFDENISSIIVQAGVIIFVSLLLFAFFITLGKPLVIRDEAIEIDPVKVDSIIVSTVLLLLNFVYFLYTAVQFSYFFHGDPSSTSLQYTYAEYARRGFTELTIVSLINLSILFFLTHAGTYKNTKLPAFIKLLLSVLVTFTFVMLTSAFHRLSLYEKAFGYTYSRVFAHAFMILLFILLMLAIFKVFKQKFKLLRAMFVVSLAAYVIVNYLNIDKLIVVKNLERYEETGRLGKNYLSTLSSDAIPTLIRYDNEEIHQLLKEKASEMRSISDEWQSYNYSQVKAKQLLEKWNLSERE